MALEKVVKPELEPDTTRGPHVARGPVINKMGAHGGAPPMRRAIHDAVRLRLQKKTTT